MIQQFSFVLCLSFTYVTEEVRYLRIEYLSGHEGKGGRYFHASFPSSTFLSLSLSRSHSIIHSYKPSSTNSLPPSIHSALVSYHITAHECTLHENKRGKKKKRKAVTSTIPHASLAFFSVRSACIREISHTGPPDANAKKAAKRDQRKIIMMPEQPDFTLLMYDRGKKRVWQSASQPIRRPSRFLKTVSASQVGLMLHFLSGSIIK